MLGLFSRLRKPTKRVHGVAARPLWILASRQPSLMPRLWQSRYCSTMVYFWVAVITEDACRSEYSEAEKHKVLLLVFARLVKEMGGVPAIARKHVLPDGHPLRLTALADLKRIIELRRDGADAWLMVHADYRDAVEGDRRPAVFGNKWGVRTEAAHEILLAADLASNLMAR